MGLIDTLKDVAVLVQKADNIDLVKNVLALQTQAQEMLNENQTLKARVAELDAALNFSKTLTFREPFYYAEGDQTPYCSRCWESARKAIHVVLVFRQQDARWDCPDCKHMFLIRGGDGSGPRIIRRS